MSLSQGAWPCKSRSWTFSGRQIMVMATCPHNSGRETNIQQTVILYGLVLFPDYFPHVEGEKRLVNNQFHFCSLWLTKKWHNVSRTMWFHEKFEIGTATSLLGPNSLIFSFSSAHNADRCALPLFSQHESNWQAWWQDDHHRHCRRILWMLFTNRCIC